MFERGKYGVEYNPRTADEESRGLGWVIVVVLVVALVWLTWSLLRRPDAPEDAESEIVVERVEATNAVSRIANEPPPPPVAERSTLSKRPAKVRNLLLRLEEAEKKRDIEMAVTTIEQLRSLPGSPAADLDDALARRLGALNLKRLYELKSQQWVETVVVKSGDSASRIAAEHGSTLASLAKLNGGKIDRILVGQKLYVMNHPRFRLIVHRRARTADLHLNGKFFRRYDLKVEPVKVSGAYELPESKRAFLANEFGFAPSDREELEILLPVGTAVLVSEM